MCLVSHPIFEQCYTPEANYEEPDYLQRFIYLVFLFVIYFLNRL